MKDVQFCSSNMTSTLYAMWQIQLSCLIVAGWWRLDRQTMFSVATICWRRTLADSTTIVARAENLVTGYGTRAVVNGVDIEVGSGEIVALIGHNGAGKSTLVKAMFGLHQSRF